MSFSPSFKTWILQYLTESLPVLLAWLFATYSCLKRREENPRGAALLGMAVLLQLTVFSSIFLFEFINQMMKDPAFGLKWGRIYFGATRLLTMASWMMVAFAVFPGRPDHREIHAEPSHDSAGDGTVSTRNPT